MAGVTGTLVLPPDVELTRVGDLEPVRLSGIDCEPTDWILTRPASRSRSSVVSEDLALVLEQFRGGARIVDVVIAAARDSRRTPQDLLDELWPALSRFIDSNWLVPEGSSLATRPEPWYPPGSSLGELTLVRCLRVLEDSQVYQARSQAGADLAVKVVDAADSPSAAARVAHEADVLALLGGDPSPAVVDLVRDGDRRALVSEWCTGVPITQAAEALRGRTGEARAAIGDLLVALLDAYASIHARGILHGDVHPDNVIVEAGGRVRLIDFDLACVLGAPDEGRRRGGVPEFMDPELARALLGRAPEAGFDPRSEQYSVAALCHLVATGHPYVELPKEREEFLRVVADERPPPFRDRGIPAWPALEEVLARGLAKDAATRFGSVAEMREALAGDLTGRADEESAPSPPGWVAPFVVRVDARLRPEGALYAEGVPAGPRATVMTGAAGIAYYLLRAAMSEGDPALLASADLWVERADRWAREPRGVYDDSQGLTAEVVGSVSPYHTQSGVEVVRGLVADARGDVAGLAAAARQFVQATAPPAASLDPTLGRTSVLVPAVLLVRALRRHADRPEVTAAPLEALSSHVGRVLESVWRDIGAVEPASQPAALRYTGVAHGWAGILYATLVCSEEAAVPLPEGIEQPLEALAALAVPEGRGAVWPVLVGADYREAMPGWCHGAPGQVHLWNAAHRVLGESRYADLATRAAWSAFDNAGGGMSVCCGEAGRVFALLSMYRHSGEAAWLRRASDCLDRARPYLRAADGRRLENSLYKGELGLALAIREAACPADAAHPLFDLPPDA